MPFCLRGSPIICCQANLQFQGNQSLPSSFFPRSFPFFLYSSIFPASSPLPFSLLLLSSSFSRLLYFLAFRSLFPDPPMRPTLSITSLYLLTEGRSQIEGRCWF